MAEGDYVTWSRGGARGIHKAKENKDITEAGVSSLTDLGTLPTGQSTYNAARAAQTDTWGNIVVVVTGVQNDQFEQRYRIVGEVQTLSRRVIRQDALDYLSPLRYGNGGSGSSDDNRHERFDNDPNFHNTFLRTMSEITGFGWDSILRVQFRP